MISIAELIKAEPSQEEIRRRRVEELIPKINDIRTGQLSLLPEVTAEQLVFAREAKQKKEKALDESGAEEGQRYIAMAGLQSHWWETPLIAATILGGGLLVGKMAEHPVKPTIPDINKHQTSSTVVPARSLERAK